MTGFGEGHCQAGSLAVVVELRSVNNKFFKLSVRSSESYGALEPLIERAVRKRIKRGTVQTQVRIDRQHSPDDYRVNREVLESYRAQLQEISDDWQLPGSLALEALLPLPGVVEENVAREPDIEQEWPVIARALEEALDHLCQMRAEEGAALAADLRENCKTIAERLTHIEARLPAAVQQYQVRLLERVNRALQQHEVRLDSSDVVREIGLMTERSDVSEEIVRLSSHLEQFEAMIQQGDSTGRKLDFISQEMFREANTIGSKSSDVEIPKHVVEIKAAIERLREQVQNVE